MKALLLGANGQVGQELLRALAPLGQVVATTRGGVLPNGKACEVADFNQPDSLALLLQRIRPEVVVNAAAYTAVDRAETPDGRRDAWAINAAGPAALARIATEYGITLVHVSSDYVFDGSAERPYREDDAVCPIGVYGQSKAAGDIAVTSAPLHYIIRTSWVIGTGNNFVRTMASLAEKGVDPTVVDDQRGRLTFASQIAELIRHLLAVRPAPGVYNLTSAGDAVTWADVARRVYQLTGHDPSRVTGVSTEQYFASASGPIAPRPRNSELDLTRVRAAGFDPRTGDDLLREYLGS